MIIQYLQTVPIAKPRGSKKRLTNVSTSGVRHLLRCEAAEYPLLRGMCGGTKTFHIHRGRSTTNEKGEPLPASTLCRTSADAQPSPCTTYTVGDTVHRSWLH